MANNNITYSMDQHEDACKRSDLVLPSIQEDIKSMSGRNKIKGNIHFDCPISAAADDFVRDEINTVDFVRMSRQISLQLVSFQIPDLNTTYQHLDV